MTTREIRVPPAADPILVANSIETVITDAGLRVVVRRTLVTYPKSHHWHLKRGRDAGTLELTWWPVRNRLWASVHANRAGQWAIAAMDSLCRALEDCLDQG